MWDYNHSLGQKGLQLDNKIIFYCKLFVFLTILDLIERWKLFPFLSSGILFLSFHFCWRISFRHADVPCGFLFSVLELPISLEF